MKKYLMALLGGVVMALSGCNDGTVISLRQSQVVGLWGYSTDKVAAADGVYDEYYEFHDDGTFARYVMQDSIRYYLRGTYTLDDQRFYLTIKQFRTFMPEAGVYRYVLDYSDQAHWKRVQFMPTACSKSKITLIGSKVNESTYLHAVKQLPTTWNKEFSAPEIAVTEDAMLAQWNQLDKFVIEGDQSSYYYYYHPEDNGITFLPDGHITRCVFWVNYVWDVYHAAGDIADDEYITVYNQDCSWSLNDDVVTLTCAKYTKYVPNSNGNPTNLQEVTLRTPLKMNFRVHVLTDYYLILLNEQNGCYHAFYRQPLPAANAPKQIDNDRDNIQKNIPFVDAGGAEWRCARVGTNRVVAPAD